METPSCTCLGCAKSQKALPPLGLCGSTAPNPELLQGDAAIPRGEKAEEGLNLL